MALRKENFDDNEEQSSKTTKRPRITIDVSPELRRRIKIAASQNDLSISEYIGKILNQAVPDEPSTIQQERQPITLEAIERLRAIREQILQDRNGRPFEDSAEMIHEMREERSRELDQL